MIRDQQDAAVAPGLVALVDSWRRQGEPRQAGIGWPRERWIRALPQYAPLFGRLPPKLARREVRAIAQNALAADAPVDAFLVTMAWGYGHVGYGPHRVTEMQAATPDLEAKLDIAASLAAGGRPIDAYAALAKDCRIAGLGPAFGTKYLYFASPLEKPALIFDSLVAAGLNRTTGTRLSSTAWNPRTYADYLSLMAHSAAALHVAPDVLEELIFTAESKRSGNQWAPE